MNHHLFISSYINYHKFSVDSVYNFYLIGTDDNFKYVNYNNTIPQTSYFHLEYDSRNGFISGTPLYFFKEKGLGCLINYNIAINYYHIKAFLKFIETNDLLINCYPVDSYYDDEDRPEYYLANITGTPDEKYVFTMCLPIPDSVPVKKYISYNIYKRNVSTVINSVGYMNKQVISNSYCNSNKLLASNDRFIWVYGSITDDFKLKYIMSKYPANTMYLRSHKIYYGGIRNTYDGICYMDLNDSFHYSKLKIDTNWKNIKSDLDNYYASYHKTDSMVSRYINMLGFKDNNLLVMLRDKWVDTLTEKKEQNDSVDYNFAWYENTIYTLDFRTKKFGEYTWDTLNLHEAFSMLQVPEKWVVENREVGKPNLYANVPIDYFGIYKWSDNELAVALQPKDVLLIHPDLENANRILLIYNFDTKKWSKFTFPNTFPSYSNKTVTDWNGSKYFHITSSNASDTTYRNALVKWTPNTGITAETELSTLKVYPNPTETSSTIILDITTPCEVMITLKDLLGKKLNTIYNGFIASGTFTKTFSTINLPKGIYYVEAVYNGNVVIEKIVVE